MGKKVKAKPRIVKFLNTTIKFLNIAQSTKKYAGGTSAHSGYLCFKKHIKAKYPNSEIVFGTEPEFILEGGPNKTNTYRLDYGAVIDECLFIGGEYDEPTHREKDAIKYFHPEYSDEELEEELLHKIARDEFINTVFPNHPCRALIRINSNSTEAMVERGIIQFLDQITVFQKRKQIKISSDIDGVWESPEEVIQKQYNINPFSEDPNDQEKLKVIYDGLENNELFWNNLKTLPHVYIGTPITPNFFVTARKVNRFIVRQFLHKYRMLKCTNKNICREIKRKYYYVEYGETKTITLKQLGVKLHIEDNIKNYEDCLNRGVACLLMTSKYNTHYTTPHRINSLDEIEIMDKYNEYFFKHKNRVFKC